MKMYEKLKPVKAWVRDRTHNPDVTLEEVLALAAQHFELDHEESMAMCESFGVQYVRVQRIQRLLKGS